MSDLSLPTELAPATEEARSAESEALSRRSREAVRLLLEAAEAISDGEPAYARRLMARARRRLGSWW